MKTLTQLIIRGNIILIVIVYLTNKINFRIICSDILDGVDFTTVALDDAYFLDSEIWTFSGEQYASSSCATNSGSYSMDDTMMPITAHNVVYMIILY
jgi:hypothetical protein